MQCRLIIKRYTTTGMVAGADKRLTDKLNNIGAVESNKMMVVA